MISMPELEQTEKVAVAWLERALELGVWTGIGRGDGSEDLGG